MRILISFLLIMASLSYSFAQNFNMAAGTVNVDCTTGGVLFDSGGPGGNYSDNESIIMTICPGSAGFGVYVEVNNIDLGTGDELCLYDGTDVLAPLITCVPDLGGGINPQAGSIFQSTVNNPSGCITFQFSSNADGDVGNFSFDLLCGVRCQEVVSSINFSDPTETLDTTDGEFYVNMCLGDTLFVNGTASFPDNGIDYNQSVSSSTFNWVWGEDYNQIPELGVSQSHVYDQPGGYIVFLTVFDTLGCRNFQDQYLKVRVAPEPEFLPLIDSLLCLGETDTLSALPSGIVSGGNVVVGETEYFIPPFFTGDTTYIPDGTGSSYTSTTFVSGFDNSAMIENCGDIVEICMQLEHSFSGDLDILLICPNGQSVTILGSTTSPGSTNFGEPYATATVDGNTADPTPGIPYEYCFSSFNNNFLTLAEEAGGSSYTYTTVPSQNGVTSTYTDDYFPPGTYLPETPFSNLIGCPINGAWQLSFTDNLGADNGWLFNWELNIDGCMFPNVDSFTVYYDFGYWDPAPTITGIVGNPNTITIQPDTIGLTTYTYHTTNQFGCEYEHDYSIYTNGFEVVASPSDTSICGDSLQLNAELVNVPLEYLDSYIVNSVPAAPYPVVGFVGVTLGDDQLSAPIALPFPFTFAGNPQTNFSISSNGFITFSPNGSGCCIGQNLPDANQPNDLIALFWSDLNPGNGGQIGYFVSGTAPNRVLVVVFNNVPHFGGGQLVSGQIVLHETTNEVEIICTSCNTDNGIITIGIENQDGTAGYPAPGHNATAAAAINQAWSYVPETTLSNYNFLWTPNVNISSNVVQDPMVWPSVSTDYIVSVTNTSYNCTYSDTARITVGGAFTHGISNDTIICQGEAVQLEATGGALTFAWTPNDGTISDTTIANPIFSPDSTTTYTVALDSNSCTVYESVTVYVSQLGVDSTLVLNESCAGAADGSISIFASGGLGTTQYSIDNGANFGSNNVFQNLAAGIYDIIVTDSASCDTSYQVEILGGLPLAFDSIILTNPLCGNVNDGSIQVYPAGGVAPFQFSIDSGTTLQGDSLFTDLAGGNYVVYLEDALGCSIDSSVSLNQPDTLVLSLVQADSLTCYQSLDGSIEVVALGGITPYLYSIDGINYVGGNVFSSLDTGSYTLYVMDAASCLDSLQVDVFQPDSLILTNVQVDSTNCFAASLGSSISFDGLGGIAPYTYSIGGPFGASNLFTDLPAQNYSLQIQDANGCLSAVFDTTVFEPSLLEFILDSTINATCGFNNGEIHVSGFGGTAPYSFSLGANPGQATGSFTGLSSGNYSITITDANGCDTVQAVFLDGFPAASLNLDNVDSVTCFGLDDGLIEVSAVSGTTPFEFSIDNGVNFQTSGTFSNLTANTYTIILRDSVLCTDTLVVSVEQPNLLVLSASQDSVVCFGEANGAINLSVLGGTAAYQYSISDDLALQSSTNFASLAAGLYSAYTVDANGCRDSLDIEVLEPTLLQITSTSATDVSCAGDNNGSITVNVTGGVLAYSYSIDNVNFQSSNVFNNLNGGIYTIVVNDNNACVATAVDSIFEPLPLLLSLVSSVNVTCNGGNDGSLEVSTIQGTAPYQYSLTGGIPFQSSGVFTNLTANTYNVTVRDAAGCEEVLTQVITQPVPLVVLIDSNNLACFGDTDGSISVLSITGETAPYTVSFNAGTPVTYVPGLSFSNLGEGVYNISIEDSNGCPNPAYSRNVAIESPSLFAIDTIIYQDPLCDAGSDGSISILANGGGVPSYEYHIFVAGDTLSNTTGIFNNLEEGDYAVWIVDQNGCFDQDIINLVAPPPLSVDTDRVFNASCWSYADGQIWVVGEGGTPYTSGTTLYDFALEDGTPAVVGTFVGLAEGTYTIIVTDANGCQASRQVFVGEPDPVFAEISPQDTLIEMGDTLSLSVVPTNALGTDYIYVWSPSQGLSCTDCANPLVSINNDTEYTLTFYDENGCFTTTTVYIEVSDSLRYFIPNAFTPDGSGGINDIFQVLGQDLKYVDMMVFNRWGEKVYETNNSLLGWDGYFKGTLQNPGVYTYYIKITFLNDETVDHKGSVTLLR
ncbi:MAG: gliding motility-associated C-terminal domain-containing protein [Chitinophagales bacterium]